MMPLMPSRLHLNTWKNRPLIPEVTAWRILPPRTHKKTTNLRCSQPEVGPRGNAASGRKAGGDERKCVQWGSSSRERPLHSNHHHSQRWPYCHQTPLGTRKRGDVTVAERQDTCVGNALMLLHPRKLSIRKADRALKRNVTYRMDREPMGRPFAQSAVDQVTGKISAG